MIKRLSRAFLVLLLSTYCQPLATPPKVALRPLVATETQCLAWAIHDEARGEPIKGARAVLDAILTRIEKRNKTACEVVAEPKQFSGYKPFVAFTVDDSMLASYKKASKLAPVVLGCSFFHATYVRPKWAKNMTKCKQVGKHIYYKEKHK